MKSFSIIISRRRPNPARRSLGTAAGLLLAGALLVTGIGWVGFECVAPASAPAVSLDPMIPLFPFTTVYLLSLQP